jgi:predicted dehydrogenase
LIEAKDFLTAIDRGASIWPSFRDGHEVNRVVAAIRASDAARTWVPLAAR